MSVRQPSKSRRNALLALQLAVLGLMMAALACTANDTLFIRLTETPTPTITPTPLNIQTRIKVGESGVIISISEFTVISLPPLPGPYRPGVVGGTTCFPNTRLRVLDVSYNLEDPEDETVYYQVQCTGLGWAPEYRLSRFAKFDSAVIKTPGGEGAPLYPNPEARNPLAERCAEGTEVSVLSVTNSPFDAADTNIYVQVTCDALSGYVLESLLAPVS